MATHYTLGVDFGGSSSKATLLDESGVILATSTREYPASYPFPGWFEQDIEELCLAFVDNVRECLDHSGIDPGQIQAVALDAATHMAVFCDAEDRPIRPMIHWSDSRCSEEVQYLKENCADILARNTLNSVSPAWTLPQMLWLQKHEPETLKKTHRIYFAKDYIRHRITGDFFTDDIEAMGPMLANDYVGSWSDELCGLVGINPGCLPEIRKPTDVAGYVQHEMALLTGLKEGTPVIMGTTDTALEVYASGAIAEGCATVKLATAGRICPITTGPIHNHQFFNYRHIIPGLWYPGTTSRTCASSYRWYRDVFGSKEIEDARKLGTSAYELLNREAEKVPAGSEGLFFHPYLQGELTPYYDDTLCASFTGVRMHHTKGHFSRAVMEGISYSTRDCMEEIKAQKIHVADYRVIGGGAKGRLWRQILCDVLATPLICTSENDSSLGSAMLAGVAMGLFTSYKDSVEKCVRITERMEPIPENVETYEKGFHIYRSIQKALADVYHQASGDMPKT